MSVRVGSDLSRCTAPVEGHRPGSRLEAECPACNQRSASCSPGQHPLLPPDALNVSRPPAVKVGDRTPWGVATAIDVMGEGAAGVTTSGHGGVKLTRELNARIPSALRRSGGWYEEDCDEAIVQAFLPEIYTRASDTDAVRRDGVRGVKNWYPDEWTAATGEAVDVAESTELQRRAKDASIEASLGQARRSAGAQGFVAVRTSSDAPWAPQGWMAVRADDAEGNHKTFLVPSDRVARVEPGMSDLRPVSVADIPHVDITQIVRIGEYPTPEPPALLVGDDLAPDFTGLTARQAQQAKEELDRPYRWSDGRIETLLGRMQREGSRERYRSGTKHLVSYGTSSHVFVVKAATFRALSCLPDSTSTGDELAREIDSITTKRDNLRESISRSTSWERRTAAQGELLGLESRLTDLRERLRADADRTRREAEERGWLQDPQDRSRAQEAAFYATVAALNGWDDLPPASVGAWRVVMSRGGDAIAHPERITADERAAARMLFG